MKVNLYLNLINKLLIENIKYSNQMFSQSKIGFIK